jgi:uncharacterized caspase-like protein
MRLTRLFWLCLLLALVAPAFADDKPLKGVALVIGESDYSGELHPLANPKSDARAMDGLLGDLGFDVTRVLDGDGRKLASEIADFVDEAKDADVALVYYSGHGIEAGGLNYLVPVDADLSTPQAAGATLIPLSEMLDELAKTVPVTIVLLDACRTNAFPAGTMIQPPGAPAPIPAVESGLAEVRGPTPVARMGVPATNLGMLIGFAASPGQPALDGAPGEENSPYAAALLKHLGAGGYSFADLMTMVGEEVYLKTKAQQLPWVNSSLRRVLSFGRALPVGDPDQALISQGRRGLLLAIAGTPDSTRKYVETISSSEDVPLDALYGMLQVLGVDTSDPAKRDQQLLDGAKQLKEFIEHAPATIRQDAELARLNGLADEARGEGAMAAARHFRDLATTRARQLNDMLASTEADFVAAKKEIAETFSRDAEDAALNFDFVHAAALFHEAYDTVQRWDDDAASRYRRSEARALLSDGVNHAHTPQLRLAVEIMQELIDKLPADTPQSDRAKLMASLGDALSMLGTLEGDNVSATRALAIYHDALNAMARADDEQLWAQLQSSLGFDAWALGSRDASNDHLLEARSAFLSALEVWTRTSNPVDWATTQANLGNALMLLGMRESTPDHLIEASDALNAALDALAKDDPTRGVVQSNLGLTLWTLSQRRSGEDDLGAARSVLAEAVAAIDRDRLPAPWGMARNNQGLVWLSLGQINADVPTLEQARVAFEEAAATFSRSDGPVQWGLMKSNLAFTIQTLGQMQNDFSGFDEALQLYDEALTVITRQGATSQWALVENNRGLALSLLGQQRKDAAMLARAVAVQRLVLEEWTLARAPLQFGLGETNLAYTLLQAGLLASGTDELAESVTAFEAVLDAFGPNLGPDQLGTIEANIGFGLEAIGTRTGSAEKLAAAVAAYRRAEAVVTKEAAPAEWASLEERIATIEAATAGQGRSVGDVRQDR